MAQADEGNRARKPRGRTFRRQVSWLPGRGGSNRLGAFLSGPSKSREDGRENSPANPPGCAVYLLGQSLLGAESGHVRTPASAGRATWASAGPAFPVRLEDHLEQPLRLPAARAGRHNSRVPSDDLRADARAVILAVLPGSGLDTDTERFLTQGGCAVLLGETRLEYVARAMSHERMRDETAAWLHGLTSAVHAAAGGRAIVAVDQEMPGIQRLHRLVPPLPGHAALASLPEAEIEAAVAVAAAEAAQLGVTLFLAPILDVYREPAPQLAGRVVLGSPAEVARVGAAYVRGARTAGIAAAATFRSHGPVLQRTREGGLRRAVPRSESACRRGD